MKNEGLSNLLFAILMILFVMFLGDQVIHRDNYNVTQAHKFLVQQGISQKIERFENRLNQ